MPLPMKKFSSTYQGGHSGKQNSVAVVQISDALGALLNAVKALATNKGI